MLFIFYMGVPDIYMYSLSGDLKTLEQIKN